MQTDLGLQAERTALAWRRTALALLVTNSLLLRWNSQHGWIVLIPMLIGMLLFLMTVVRQDERYRKKVAGLAQQRIDPEIAMVLFMAGSILAMTMTACYVVISGA